MLWVEKYAKAAEESAKASEEAAKTAKFTATTAKWVGISLIVLTALYALVTLGMWIWPGGPPWRP